MGKLRVLDQVIRAYKDWPLYLAAYYGLVKRDITIRTRDGLSFTVRIDKGDLGPIGEVFHLRHYDPPQGEIRSGDIVIDIGAHMGYFSLYAANKGAEVFAFEAFPEHCRHIKDHALQNGRVVRVFNEAISDMMGDMNFYIAKNNGCNSLYRKTDEKITVRGVTLKHIFEREQLDHCDYLKVDCEGAEYGILMTLPDEVLSKIRRIVLEYHFGPEFGQPKEKPKQLKSFLEQKGYRVEDVPVNPSNGMMYAVRTA